MEEIETSTQDVNSQESSAPAEETNTQQSQAQPEATQQHVPYERFQEVVRARQEMEQRIAKMEQQWQEQLAKSQPQSKPANPFVEDLRKINPEYAKTIEDLIARASKADTLEERLQRFEHSQVRNEYESAVHRLHDTHKTPANVRDFVKELLDSQARSGELKTMDQLEAAYKKQAERFTKLVEGTKRETTKSYVSDKSKDASVPAPQPRGKIASGKAEKFSGPREDLLASIAKEVASKSRADRDA